MRRHPAWLFVLGVSSLAACAAPPGSGETETETGSDPTSTSETSGVSTGTETGEVEDACGCAEGELCVAECSEEAPGFPGTDSSPENLRCIDDPVCVDMDPNNPACRALVCDSAFHEFVEFCSGDDTPGIDLLCEWYPAITECTSEIQDCPEGEKCVPWILDDELATNACVEVTGDAPPGSPCTHEGPPDNLDSCDLDGACWGEGPMIGPFAGTCLAFCTPDCPAGSTCQILDPGGSIQLCVPDP